MARHLALFCLFVGLITLSSALTDYEEDMQEAYDRNEFYGQFAAQPQGTGQPRTGGSPEQPATQQRGLPYNGGYFNSPFSYWFG